MRFARGCVLCVFAVVLAGCPVRPGRAEPEFNVRFSVEPAEVVREREVALRYPPGTFPVPSRLDTVAEFGAVPSRTLSLQPEDHIEEWCLENPVELVDLETDEVLAVIPSGTCLTQDAYVIDLG